MTRRTRKWGIALLSGLAILTLGIVLFDWNLLKDYTEARVQEATGRQLEIGGDLDVDLGWHPRVRMERVRFANTEWGSAPVMFEAEVLEFSVAVWEWMNGRLRVPEVSLSRPSILLEKHPDGRGNWILERSQRDRNKAPHIDVLTVDNGRIRYRSPQIGTDIRATVATIARPEQGSGLVTAVTGEGRFYDTSLRFQGQGGSILRLEAGDKPFPIDLAFETANAKASFRGTVTALTKFDAADLRFSIRGQDLSSLSSLARVNLPKTPPFSGSGRLKHEGAVWAFHDLGAKVGANDAAGFLSITTGEPRPFVRADLVSRRLDLTAFQRPEKGERTERPLLFDRLRTLDADIKLAVADVDWRKLPLGRLKVEANLKNGRLALDPLVLGLAGGTMQGNAVVDANRTPPQSSLSAEFRKLQLGQLLPRLEGERAGFGALGGRARVSATGNRPQAMLASLAGEAGFAMSGGQISNLALELIGLDAGEALRFLIGRDRQVAIRCAVADFAIKQGTMEARTFVFDTTDTAILGGGMIDLGKQTIDFTLRPRPKDVSFLSIRAPIHVTGSLLKPDFQPDMRAVIRGGAAVLLGVLALPAAIIPLIETGPGKDSDCGALISQVEKHTGATPP
ncbi:MAG: AsmA family protein [Thiobacillus sp.]|nr:AsmA family protein [Thiobacillus sp.]